jgi:polysaccharide biosynthesis protein PslH
MNNFLSIVWYKVLPPEYGGQKGIAYFNDSLGQKVSLSCFCSRNNQPDKVLSYKLRNELPVSRFQFWNPFVRNKILSFIRQQSFTHIIIEHPYHGWLGKYKQKPGFRFIVHAHNIEHLRMKARAKLWWRLIKRTEQKAFALADHILFKTDADKIQAIRLFNIAPGKCFIVPYGIQESRQPAVNTTIKEQLRKKYNLAPDEKMLLFAATLDYEPNARALATIISIIIPLLQKKGFCFRVVICGSLPPKKIMELNALPCITAAGFVSSLDNLMQAADVFINPVVSGSGIQTKNIEAVASGCNVVATHFAATGLPVYLLNEKVFVSPDNDWDLFTNNIITASALKQNTPQLFYEEYNWENIIARLLTAIEAG